jgi:C4-dicarboxylate-specific signal transduction histidine kinase
VNLFAGKAAQVLSGFIGMEFTALPGEALDAGICTEKNVVISILFTGTAYGEFIFAMSEETAVAIVKATGSTETDPKRLRLEIRDLLSEMLNMAAGESVNSLLDLAKQATITAPRVNFGEVVYPKLRGSRALLHSAAGEIECLLYVDKMKLDIAESLKQTLSSLLSMHKRLKSAMKKMSDQQGRLVEAEKMSALGLMAGGVAHEINTPLCLILLQEGRLREMIEENHVEKSEAIRSLDSIAKTVNRISRITHALGVVAKGAAVEPITQSNLIDILLASIAHIEDSGKSSGVIVDLSQVSSDLMLDCRVDQISQVFQCLLENAAEAVKGLDAPTVQIRATAEDEALEIRVSDTGRGISKEIAGRIFDPFFTTKDLGAGLGLSLSIAKAIVQSHSGTIYLNMASPHTEFVIRLPRESKLSRAA